MIQDLRFAFRSLLRRKALLAVAVATLAIGVGATTALFSMVNGVLLQPLPYRDAGRLAVLWHVFGQGAQDLPNMHPLDYRDYRDRSVTLEELTIATGSQSLIGDETNAEIVQVGWVDGNFFPFLGVDPVLGRHFAPEENEPGAPPVLMLSHALWQRRFGGDPAIVGRTVPMGPQQAEIVGVLPASFHLELPAETYGLRDADIYRPARINYDRQPPRNLTAYAVFARLKTGVTFEQAQADLETIAGQLREEVPEHAASDLRVKVIPFHHDVVKGHRAGLLMLMAAVGLVLVIACANVALLMLARSRGRERELLVRSALGASRRRIARLVFAESLIVGLLGGVAGVALARVAMLVVDARALSTVPRLDAAAIDLGVLAFALAATLVSAVVFGLAPAVRAARLDIADSLRAAAVGSVSRAGGRFREAIIVTQIAVGLILVVGAGLVVQSFRALADAHPGFEPRGVLTMRVAMPFAGFDSPAAVRAFHAVIAERLGALPGVTAVAATSQLPLTGQGPLQPYAYDEETARNWEKTSADGINVTPGYFRAMGATLLAGRDLTQDDITNARRVIVIDDSLAARAYGGAPQAVGKRLQLEPEDTPESFAEVVGVVRHMKYHDLQREMLPQIFRPGVFLSFSVVLRTDGDAAALAGPARRTIADLRPGSAVQNVRVLSDLVDEALGPMRLAVWLMTGFGAIALALGAIGIYGVFSYFVGERTREIAVRLALGATPSAVRRLVVGRGLVLLVLGLALGLAGAVALAASASGLLYSVSARDPRTYAAAAACLAAVAMGACWLPAHRASRLDPQAGLRQG